MADVPATDELVERLREYPDESMGCDILALIARIDAERTRAGAAEERAEADRRMRSRACEAGVIRDEIIAELKAKVERLTCERDAAEARANGLALRLSDRILGDTP